MVGGGKDGRSWMVGWLLKVREELVTTKGGCIVEKVLGFVL